MLQLASITSDGKNNKNRKVLSLWNSLRPEVSKNLYKNNFLKKKRKRKTRDSLE